MRSIVFVLYKSQREREKTVNELKVWSAKKARKEGIVAELVRSGLTRWEMWEIIVIVITPFVSGAPGRGIMLLGGSVEWYSGSLGRFRNGVCE